MKMMKIEHPLPSYNRTGAMMLKKTGHKRLAPSILERPLAQRILQIFGKIAFMTFAMALARRKQNLQQSFWPRPKPIREILCDV